MLQPADEVFRITPTTAGNDGVSIIYKRPGLLAEVRGNAFRPVALVDLIITHGNRIVGRVTGVASKRVISPPPRMSKAVFSGVVDMTVQAVIQNTSPKTRLIMYHKSPSSGMTKFLRQDNKSVCAFDALPKLSTVIEWDERPRDEKLLGHPSPLVKRAAEWLGMEQASFELESEYCEKVDAVDGPLTVYLARFKTIDPPEECAGKVGGKFITLTEAVGLPPAEMELLRRAYEVIMEG